MNTTTNTTTQSADLEARARVIDSLLPKAEAIAEHMAMQIARLSEDCNWDARLRPPFNPDSWAPVDEPDDTPTVTVRVSDGSDGEISTTAVPHYRYIPGLSWDRARHLGIPEEPAELELISIGWTDPDDGRDYEVIHTDDDGRETDVTDLMRPLIQEALGDLYTAR